MLPGEKSKLADVLIVAVLLFSCIITLLPIVHIVSVSLSDPVSVYRTPIMLYPQNINVFSYDYIFGTPALMRSFGITVFITVAGTLLNLVLTVPAAYALSKRSLPGLPLFMLLTVLVMTFNAGIVPNYLNIKNFGLLDSIGALIIPGAVNAFYLILMRNFFMDLPQEIEESARMDGCGDWRLLTRIVMPLSAPVMATIGLFYGVSHWNEFFKGVFYINDINKWPLQVLLKSIVFDGNFTNLVTAENVNQQVEPANIQAAAIVFATVPILVVYPFLQKYFVKGLVMGAVKG